MEPIKNLKRIIYLVLNEMRRYICLWVIHSHEFGILES